MFYFVLPMIGRKLTFEILLLVDIVSSYSFELSQKTIPTSFCPKLLTHLSSYLKAIEKVFFLFTYLHQNIYGM